MIYNDFYHIATKKERRRKKKRTIRYISQTFDFCRVIAPVKRH